jgi:hypothetical protein
MPFKLLKVNKPPFTGTLSCLRKGKRAIGASRSQYLLLNCPEFSGETFGLYEFVMCTMFLDPSILHD